MDPVDPDPEHWLRIPIRDPVPFWPSDPGWVKYQDPVPGSGAFLTSGSGMGKKSGSGSVAFLAIGSGMGKKNRDPDPG